MSTLLNSIVPELEIMTVIHPSTTKIHYSKCAAPLKRPFLLAGKLASHAAEVKCYENDLLLRERILSTCFVHGYTPPD